MSRRCVCKVPLLAFTVLVEACYRAVHVTGHIQQSGEKAAHTDIGKSTQTSVPTRIALSGLFRMTESQTVLWCWTQEQQPLPYDLDLSTCVAGSTVFLYGSLLLFMAFVVPRVAMMGLLGIERSLVTTLLGFEALLTQALFSAAKWVSTLQA